MKGRAREDVVGKVIGGRRILADLRDGRRMFKLTRRVLCICLGCGATRESALNSLRGTSTCHVCCEDGRAEKRGAAQRVRAARTRERREFFAAIRRATPWLWSETKAMQRMIQQLPVEARRDIEERRYEAARELEALVGPMTLAEIGELFGVTRERIRQIEARASGHLRRAARNAGLEPPDERGEYTYPDHDVEAA